MKSGVALSPTPCSIAGFWKWRDSEASRPAPGALALEDGESGVYLVVYHVRRGFVPICRGVAAALRYGASGGRLLHREPTGSACRDCAHAVDQPAHSQSSCASPEPMLLQIAARRIDLPGTRGPKPPIPGHQDRRNEVGEALRRHRSRLRAGCQIYVGAAGL